MGNACCCCDDDERSFDPRQRRGYRTVHGQHHHGFAMPANEAIRNECRICGKTIDPSLLDGHEETCRAQVRRQMREAQEHQQQHQQSEKEEGPHRSDVDDGAGGEVDPEHECLICCARERNCVVASCNHIVSCKECAARLHNCPICRAPKERVIAIPNVRNALRCRVCKHAVSPAFLESHQEVCRLRMRKLKEQIREEQQEQVSQGRFVRADSSDEHSTFDPEKCFSCQKAPREVAYQPCFHYVDCAVCGKKAQQCPVCLERVAGVLTMYD